MAHRRPWCGHCVYWAPDQTSKPATIGHCHRFPPGVAFNSKNSTLVQKFPTTDRNEWCGEWSGDESHLIEAAHEIAREIAQETVDSHD